MNVAKTRADRLHRRWKPLTACLECRSRKRKCNRESPKCAQCKTQGRACVYAPVEERGGRVDQAYVKDLENEIQTLRSALEARNAGKLPEDAALSNSSSRTVSETVEPSQSFPGPVQARSSAPNPTPNEEAIDTSASSSIPQLTAQPPEPPIDQESLRVLRNKELLQEVRDAFFAQINNLHHFVADDYDPVKAVSPFECDLQLLRSAVLAAGASTLPWIQDALLLSDISVRHAASILPRCCKDFQSAAVVQALGVLSWRESFLGNKGMAKRYRLMSDDIAEKLALVKSSNG